MMELQDGKQYETRNGLTAKISRIITVKECPSVMYEIAKVLNMQPDKYADTYEWLDKIGQEKVAVGRVDDVALMIVDPVWDQKTGKFFEYNSGGMLREVFEGR
ncbi:MAG: hypothetical protein LBU27_06240 [Candidatus Peribacteria bacterium]|jgi:hypothetical protein|nr:hypothetical protein [Candidatus Peribacteria bacterium]